jgi:hypothetical protein
MEETAGITEAVSVTNKPLTLEKNADLRRLWWLGHFDNCWLV